MHRASDYWQRMETLFESAVALPSDQREMFLHHHCADDEQLRAEVQRLIGAHEQAGSFLETNGRTNLWPLASEVNSPSLIGRCFNQYRVTALIGSGGMGVV